MTASPRPIRADDLFLFTLVGDAQVSPDGKEIAHVVKRLDREADDYVSNIYVAVDGATRQFTAGGKDSAPRWSPDGRWLAFVSGRDDTSQIYLMPAHGGEPLRLTDMPKGAGIPAWSPDSRHIAFAAGVPVSEPPNEEPKNQQARVIERAVYKFDGRGFIDDRRTHIHVVDIESREIRQITHGDFNHTSPSWSPEGTHLAFAANRNEDWDLQAESDIWIVPCGGGEPRRITLVRGAWGNPVFSPDGSRIAFVGYARPEEGEPTYYPQLFTVSRGGGEPCNLLADTDMAVGNSVGCDWSAAGDEGLVWTEDGIFFIASQRGTSNVQCWRDGVKPLTAGRHHIMDFSVGGRVVAFTCSEATRPAEIFALARGMKARQVTSHNAEALRVVAPVQPEHLTFTGSEGEEIDGWLMRPAGFVEGQRYPLIVYIHGGPVSAYGETFFHEFQVLAGQGFGLFYSNPHGSSSVGRHFQVSIMGDWGNLDYADVMAGVDRVIEERWVDPHRMGVAGGSYGGFMVNWIVSHTSRFAAACTQRSICNHLSQGGTSDWAATRGERLGGTPESKPEKLWTMSPLKYVSNVTTPTLILHSERDDRCPIEQGEQWFAALKRLRVPVRFVRFPEESHGLSRGGKPSRRLDRMDHIIRWFKTYL